METTEKIVESYCRYVKQWFTIPNIKCRGQYEIDLLAVDTTSPKKMGRYHNRVWCIDFRIIFEADGQAILHRAASDKGSTDGPTSHYRFLYRAEVRTGPSTDGT